MRRAPGTRWVTTAIAALMLLAVGATLGAGATHFASPSRSLGASPTSAPAPAIHPAVTPRPAAGNVTAQVFIDSNLSLYSILPANVKFHLVVTNTVIVGASGGAAQNTFVWVEVRDVTSECTGLAGLVVLCPTVTFFDLNSSIANGTTSYNFTLDTGLLSTPIFRANCPVAFGLGNPCPYVPFGAPFPDDPYQVYIWANVSNSNTTTIVSASQTLYLVTISPWATLVSPSTTAQASIGNQTVVATYGGSYLGGANVQISPANNKSTLVYSSGVFTLATGNRTGWSTTPWTVGNPGAYLVNITLSTPYGSFTFWSNVTVGTSGGTVYQNTTTWHNATGSLFSGLSGGASASILLVVGLIIGMIVALALGRAMWGSPKAAPAQPWTAKSTNECSICHQTFGSETEMKEHAKAAHGVQM
jgi:hypothetical protein